VIVKANIYVRSGVGGGRGQEPIMNKRLYTHNMKRSLDNGACSSKAISLGLFFLDILSCNTILQAEQGNSNARHVEHVLGFIIHMHTILIHY